MLFKKLNLILDFDSTICAKESLEVLASVALENDPNRDEKLRKLSEITNLGMAGTIPFQESLAKRFALLALTEKHLEIGSKIISKNISTSFLNNIDEFNKYNTFVISGGFKSLIDDSLKSYGFDTNKIYANFLECDKVGCKLIPKSPLCKSHGKAELVKLLKLDGKTVIVGDGISDYEIKDTGLADIFIYYNEFVKREPIIALADYTANSFSEVIEILKKI